MRVPVEPTNEIDEFFLLREIHVQPPPVAGGSLDPMPLPTLQDYKRHPRTWADLQGDFPTFFPTMVNLAQPYHISVLYSTGGGWGGNRTPDTRIFSPLLCQLSYPAFSGEEEGLRNGPRLTRGMVENVWSKAPAALVPARSDFFRGRGQGRRAFRAFPGRFG
jgi:hypothetical protein